MLLLCNERRRRPRPGPAGKFVMKIVANNPPHHITGDFTSEIAMRGPRDEAKNRGPTISSTSLRTKSILNLNRLLLLKRVVHSPVDMERAIPSAVHGTVTHGAFLPGPGRCPSAHTGPRSLPHAGCQCLSLRLRQPPRRRRSHGPGLRRRPGNPGRPYDKMMCNVTAFFSFFYRWHFPACA